MKSAGKDAPAKTLPPGKRGGYIDHEERKAYLRTLDAQGLSIAEMGARIAVSEGALRWWILHHMEDLRPKLRAESEARATKAYGEIRARSKAYQHLDDIKRLRSEGKTIGQIADQLGLWKSPVTNICKKYGFTRGTPEVKAGDGPLETVRGCASWWPEKLEVLARCLRDGTPKNRTAEALGVSSHGLCSALTDLYLRAKASGAAGDGVEPSMRSGRATTWNDARKHWTSKRLDILDRGLCERWTVPVLCEKTGTPRRLLDHGIVILYARLLRRNAKAAQQPDRMAA